MVFYLLIIRGFLYSPLLLPNLIVPALEFLCLVKTIIGVLMGRWNEFGEKSQITQYNYSMNVAIIDAELTDQSRHRFPNLACMKLSSYHKTKKDKVKLLLNYNNLDKYDSIYVSKVFTSTNTPKDIEKKSNVKIGGTGFFYDKYDNAPMLPKEIEHSRPDYSLYDNWIQEQRKLGANSNDLKYYTDYSIGFTTRGCTRKCPFCVNRHSSTVLLASPIDEFFDVERKKICLLDDNVFAYKNWNLIFDELHTKTEQHKASFEYKQGLDLRLLTEEKAKALAKSKYAGDFIFAFDNYNDKDIISKNCALFREYVPTHCCKFYVFCGYNSQDEKDLSTVFERIKILWRYKCLAYIMKHERFENAPEPYRNMYVQLGRWCNQPQFQWSKSLRDFCFESGGRALKGLRHFEQLHPDFKPYLDMMYPFSKSENMTELVKLVPDKNVKTILKCLISQNTRHEKTINKLKEMVELKGGKVSELQKRNKIQKPNQKEEGLIRSFLVEDAPEKQDVPEIKKELNLGIIPAVKEILHKYETDRFKFLT
jgi:hypothetical protein